MNRCEQVEKLLLTGESLSQDDQDHLNLCPSCQKTASLITDLCDAGKQVAMSDVVEPNLVASVRRKVLEQIEPRPARRWVRAVSALGAGVLGVVFLLVVIGRNPQPDKEPGEDLLAFMDEVALDQWSEQEYEELGIESDLLGEVDMATEGYGEDWSVPLSDSYLALEDIMEI